MSKDTTRTRQVPEEEIVLSGTLLGEEDPAEIVLPASMLGETQQPGVPETLKPEDEAFNRRLESGVPFTKEEADQLVPKELRRSQLWMPPVTTTPESGIIPIEQPKSIAQEQAEFVHPFDTAGEEFQQNIASLAEAADKRIASATKNILYAKSPELAEPVGNLAGKIGRYAVTAIPGAVSGIVSSVERARDTYRRGVYRTSYAIRDISKYGLTKKTAKDYAYGVVGILGGALEGYLAFDMATFNAAMGAMDPAVQDAGTSIAEQMIGKPFDQMTAEEQKNAESIQTKVQVGWSLLTAAKVGGLGMTAGVTASEAVHAVMPDLMKTLPGTTDEEAELISQTLGTVAFFGGSIAAQAGKAKIQQKVQEKFGGMEDVIPTKDVDWGEPYQIRNREYNASRTHRSYERFIPEYDPEGKQVGGQWTTVIEPIGEGVVDLRGRPESLRSDSVILDEFGRPLPSSDFTGAQAPFVLRTLPVGERSRPVSLPRGTASAEWSPTKKELVFRNANDRIITRVPVENETELSARIGDANAQALLQSRKAGKRKGEYFIAEVTSVPGEEARLSTVTELSPRAKPFPYEGPLASAPVEIIEPGVDRPREVYVPRDVVVKRFDAEGNLVETRTEKAFTPRSVGEAYDGMRNELKRIGYKVEEVNTMTDAELLGEYRMVTEFPAGMRNAPTSLTRMAMGYGEYGAQMPPPVERFIQDVARTSFFDIWKRKLDPKIRRAEIESKVREAFKSSTVLEGKEALVQGIADRVERLMTVLDTYKDPKVRDVQKVLKETLGESGAYGLLKGFGEQLEIAGQLARDRISARMKERGVDVLQMSGGLVTPTGSIVKDIIRDIADLSIFGAATLYRLAARGLGERFTLKDLERQANKVLRRDFIDELMKHGYFEFSSHHRVKRDYVSGKQSGLYGDSRGLTLDSYILKRSKTELKRLMMELYSPDWQAKDAEGQLSLIAQKKMDRELSNLTAIPPHGDLVEGELVRSRFDDVLPNLESYFGNRRIAEEYAMILLGTADADGNFNVKAASSVFSQLMAKKRVPDIIDGYSTDTYARIRLLEALNDNGVEFRLSTLGANSPLLGSIGHAIFGRRNVVILDRHMLDILGVKNEGRLSTAQYALLSDIVARNAERAGYETNLEFQEALWGKHAGPKVRDLMREEIEQISMFEKPMVERLNAPSKYNTPYFKSGLKETLERKLTGKMVTLEQVMGLARSSGKVAYDLSRLEELDAALRYLPGIVDANGAPRPGYDPPAPLRYVFQTLDLSPQEIVQYVNTKRLPREKVMNYIDDPSKAVFVSIGTNDPLDAVGAVSIGATSGTGLGVAFAREYKSRDLTRAVWHGTQMPSLNATRDGYIEIVFSVNPEKVASDGKSSHWGRTLREIPVRNTAAPIHLRATRTEIPGYGKGFVVLEAQSDRRNLMQQAIEDVFKSAESNGHTRQEVLAEYPDLEKYFAHDRVVSAGAGFNMQNRDAIRDAVNEINAMAERISRDYVDPVMRDAFRKAVPESEYVTIMEGTRPVSADASLPEAIRYIVPVPDYVREIMGPTCPSELIVEFPSKETFSRKAILRATADGKVLRTYYDIMSIDDIGKALDEFSAGVTLYGAITNGFSMNQLAPVTSRMDRIFERGLIFGEAEQVLSQKNKNNAGEYVSRYNELRKTIDRVRKEGLGIFNKDMFGSDWTNPLWHTLFRINAQDGGNFIGMLTGIDNAVFERVAAYASMLMYNVNTGELRAFVPEQTTTRSGQYRPAPERAYGDHLAVAKEVSDSVRRALERGEDPSTFTGLKPFAGQVDVTAVNNNGNPITPEMLIDVVGERAARDLLADAKLSGKGWGVVSGHLAYSQNVNGNLRGGRRIDLYDKMMKKRLEEFAAKKGIKAEMETVPVDINQYEVPSLYVLKVPPEANAKMAFSSQTLWTVGAGLLASGLTAAWLATHDGMDEVDKKEAALFTEQLGFAGMLVAAGMIGAAFRFRQGIMQSVGRDLVDGKIKPAEVAEVARRRVEDAIKGPDASEFSAKDKAELIKSVSDEEFRAEVDAMTDSYLAGRKLKDKKVVEPKQRRLPVADQSEFPDAAQRQRNAEAAVEKRRHYRTSGTQDVPSVIGDLKNLAFVYFHDAMMQGMKGEREILDHVQHRLLDKVNTMAEAGLPERRILSAIRALEAGNVSRWLSGAEKLYKKEMTLEEANLVQPEKIKWEGKQTSVESVVKLIRAADRLDIHPKEIDTMVRSLTETGIVMANMYGIAGSRLVDRAVDASNTISAWHIRFDKHIETSKKHLDALPVNERANALDRVFSAMEDRASADDILRTEQERAIYREIVDGYDYARAQLSALGYATIDDYITNIRRASMWDDYIEGGQRGSVTDLTQSKLYRLNQVITGKISSPFLIERKGGEHEILRDPIRALKIYSRSVGRVIAYKDLVGYYFNNFLDEIPYSRIKASGISGATSLSNTYVAYAMRMMDNQIFPVEQSGLGFRIADKLRNNFYQNALLWSFVSALRNRTQTDFARIRVEKDAVKIGGSIYKTRDNLPHFVALAMQEMQKDRTFLLEMERHEGFRGPEEAKTWIGSITSKLMEHEVFTQAEHRNWDYSMALGLAQDMLRNKDYRSRVNAGEDAVTVLEDYLKVEQNFYRAVRSGKRLAEETQLSSNRLLRPELFRFADAQLFKYLTMFQRFKVGQVENVYRTLFHVSGPTGVRAVSIIKRGVPEETAIVEHQLLMKTLFDASTEIKKRIEQGENVGIRLKELELVREDIKNEIRDAEVMMKEIEPTGSGIQNTPKWLKYLAKNYAINLTWKAFLAMVNPTKRDEEEGYVGAAARAVQQTAVDNIPLVSFFQDPQHAGGFVGSPLLPKTGFNPATALTKLAMNLAPPKIGIPLNLADRFSGYRISQGPQNLIKEMTKKSPGSNVNRRMDAIKRGKSTLPSR